MNDRWTKITFWSINRQKIHELTHTLPYILTLCLFWITFFQKSTWLCSEILRKATCEILWIVEADFVGYFRNIQ